MNVNLKSWYSSGDDPYLPSERIHARYVSALKALVDPSQLSTDNEHEAWVSVNRLEPLLQLIALVLQGKLFCIISVFVVVFFCK